MILDALMAAYLALDPTAADERRDAERAAEMAVAEAQARADEISRLRALAVDQAARRDQIGRSIETQKAWLANLDGTFGRAQDRLEATCARLSELTGEEIRP